MKTRILFAEDETDLGNVVRQYLEVMDFAVDWHTNGRDALAAFRKQPGEYDILLLDVSLPLLDGFQLANEVLQLAPHTFFIFLTARKEKNDRLHGLKIGADDYITKPFDIDELVLRIRNIIKRRDGGSFPLPLTSKLEAGDILFLKDALKLVIRHQPEIMLTPREAELLEYLFRHQNKVVKREDILVQLWGDNDYFLGRSLDVFISRLRKLLVHSEQVSIENVYGVGYVFKVV
ncbi:response regulator transcription factor [Chitinophaga nivalis]|uniref:Response regulator transcription factor n=1 Tax=Chitinophaga nivalis TaxID=2991709 RepID=A0ABT3IMF3_9BACT|nr:response regulator transcription factor [Chitinophaga nivalis]MCW3465166.1 response regulator transcription factor [Chitinophaga nivalis]MCW3485142.1 response regulator transcription factor [Chitinophaga nivalis]